ncbi:MAG: protein kinase domain-containing protein [Planctomycetaceae bacterium]
MTQNAESRSASPSPQSMESRVEPPLARDLASELRAKWQRGERDGIETLGESFDRIKNDEEQLLDLLYHEVLIREEFGEEARVEEFVARFPQIEERLRRQFEVHAAVDHDWRGAGFEPTDDELLNSERHQPTIGADGRTSRLMRLMADFSAPPGYELLEELGRGGMAIVFKARQQNLNRLVALKMILAGQFATEQSLARFQQEAQAVAQLQHPGIVQIHEVGEHHGLPFLSLEYVSGGTLQQWLNGRPLPDETAARLIESLARTMHFAHERGVIHRDLKPANVLLTSNPKRQRGSEPCNPKRQRGRAFQADILARRASEGSEANDGFDPSLARQASMNAASSDSSSSEAPSLADASGDMTRSSLADASGDLAQQTLPLDEFSLSTPDSPLPTPKISDFGLARQLEGNSELTATGQVIGTPSYMAPEQARQAKSSSGVAPDIYSLGAILYETLTGRPPFQAATILQTLEQVRDQEPVPPRQLQPRLPVDLETICLKCLEKSPLRRYPTALALADDLARFLNNEPITARPSGMIERSRKWIHRRPAVAALLALIGTLTVFGWTAILREAGRTNLEALRANQNEATARRDRDQAEKERRIAETERENSRQAQARAEANFLKATEVVTQFSELGNQLQNEARQQRTSSRIFDAALQFYENVLVERGDDPIVRFEAASAYLRAGEIREILGQQERSATLIDRAVELLEGLVAEDNSVAHRRQLALALRLQASNARHFVDLKKAEAAYVRCLTVTESLVRDNPEDIIDLICQGKAHVAFGVMLKGTERVEESLTMHRKAVVIFRATITRCPTSLLKNEELGNPKRERGSERSRNLKSKSLADASGYMARSSLADASGYIFQQAATEDSCQIELTNALHALGSALWYFGRTPEGESIYRECFDLSRTLLARLPNHLTVRILYARSLVSMTRLDTVAGDFDTAAARMDEAARIMDEIVSNFPDNINYLSELLWLWRDRLDLEQRRNNVPMIDRASRMELSLLGNLYPRLPPSTRNDERYALAASRFADWLWQHDKKSEARDYYTVALRVMKEVSDRLPQDATALHQLAWLHAVCPVAELRDIPLAETLATRATSLKPTGPLAWQALGAAQLRARNFTAAETSFRKALTLSPSLESMAALHALLAVTLNEQNQREEAQSELKLATERTPSAPAPQLIRILEECRGSVNQRRPSDREPEPADVSSGSATTKRQDADSSAR